MTSAEKEPAAALECGPEPAHIILIHYGDGSLPPRRTDIGPDGTKIYVSYVRYAEDPG
jgi:hypothetical protein